MVAGLRGAGKVIKITIETDNAAGILALERDIEDQAFLGRPTPMHLMVGPMMVIQGEHVIRKIHEDDFEGEKLMIKFEIDCPGQ